MDYSAFGNDFPTDTVGDENIGAPTTVDDGSGFTIPDYGPISPGSVGGIFSAMGGSTVGGTAQSVMTPVQWQGPVVAGAVTGVRAAARYIGPILASALTKISQVLGGAARSPISYGRKAFQQLSTWAKNNPGVSLVSTLVGLGLTVEEAAHFLAWGATTRRKRRSRGISGRELRTTRRTIRKLQYFSSLLSTVCPPGRHAVRRYRRHHRPFTRAR